MEGRINLIWGFVINVKALGSLLFVGNCVGRFFLHEIPGKMKFSLYFTDEVFQVPITSK